MDRVIVKCDVDYHRKLYEKLSEFTDDLDEFVENTEFFVCRTISEMMYATWYFANLIFDKKLSSVLGKVYDPRSAGDDLTEIIPVGWDIDYESSDDKPLPFPENIHEKYLFVEIGHEGDYDMIPYVITLDGILARSYDTSVDDVMILLRDGYSDKCGRSCNRSIIYQIGSSIYDISEHFHSFPSTKYTYRHSTYRSPQTISKRYVAMVSSKIGTRLWEYDTEEDLMTLGFEGMNLTYYDTIGCDIGDYRLYDITEDRTIR